MWCWGNGDIYWYSSQSICKRRLTTPFLMIRKMSLAINKTVKPIIYRLNIVMTNNLRSNIQRGYYYYGWMIIRIQGIMHERERTKEKNKTSWGEKKHHSKIEVKTFHRNLRKQIPSSSGCEAIRNTGAAHGHEIRIRITGLWRTRKNCYVFMYIFRKDLHKYIVRDIKIHK